MVEKFVVLFDVYGVGTLGLSGVAGCRLGYYLRLSAPFQPLTSFAFLPSLSGFRWLDG